MYLTRRPPAFLTSVLLCISLVTAAIPVVADPPKPDLAEKADTAGTTGDLPPSAAAPPKTVEGELVQIPEEALEPAQGPDTPLVVVPEVDHQRQRFFLSSFKLPKKLSFAGVDVPLDNWQVRERIEFEFYQFLAEEG